ncbi:MAG: PKD domain-containing protein [Planctomycetes bacterium]|nr:PKD domain-containing protein [Planctomycetota bacterium]
MAPITIASRCFAILALASALPCGAQAPTAEFTGTPLAGNVPLTVMFTDLSTTFDPVGIHAWEWDLDGDGVTDSTLQNPSFTYTMPGSYTVRLRVTDGFGNDDETKPNYVTADPPLAPKFTFTPQSGPEGTQVTFTDQSTGNPDTWDWNFGSGEGSMTRTTTTPPTQHTYNTAGKYDTKLRISRNSSPFTPYFTAPTLYIYPLSTNTKGPSYFRFPFNEPRGPYVANVSGNANMPSFATVATSTWQADPAVVGDARTNWKANEFGFGCVGLAASVGDHRITTGWPMDVTGSMTVCWWQRRAGSLPYGEAHAFGGAGGTVYAFTGGPAGNQLMYRGSPIGDFATTSDVRTSTAWTHVALVIDDVIGEATWYVDGVVDAATTFPIGAHLATNTNFHVGWHQAQALAYDGLYQMDDFILDARPYDATEIQAILQGEFAYHATFDPGTAGNVGIPQIGGSESPTLGSAFQILLSNGEPTSAGVVVLGFEVASGGFPLDLSFLTGVPSTAGVAPILFVPTATDALGNATIALPIPNTMALQHAHGYAQAIIVAPGANAASLSITPVLDILVNDC